MKSRIAVAGMAATLVAAFAAPASAAHTYLGTATSTGLELKLLEQGLTIGFSRAAVQSAQSPDGCANGVDACATGEGAAGLSDSAEAAAPGNAGPNTAVALSLDDLGLGEVLGADIGIAAAQAKPAPDSSATGDGASAQIDLTATQTVNDIVPLDETLQPVIDLLDPLSDAAPEGTVDRVQASLQEIVDNLAIAPLASISAGPTQSTVQDVGGVTTATARAQGAVIVISPTPISLPVAPEGLIIIEVGASSATATTDQRNASASFDPALIRVKILDPLSGNYDEIEVAPGVAQCVTDGTPLEGTLDLCIAAGGGETTQNGAGAAATAAGVSITLDLAGMQVLDLALARSAAGVNSAPAQVVAPPPAAPPAAPSANLPRTGSNTALPAMMMLGLAGITASTTYRRRNRNTA